MNIDNNLDEKIEYILNIYGLSKKEYKVDIVNEIKKIHILIENEKKQFFEIRPDRMLKQGLQQLKMLYNGNISFYKKVKIFLEYLEDDNLLTLNGNNEVKLILLAYKRTYITQRIKKRFKEFINSLDEVIQDKEHKDNMYFKNIKRNFITMHKNDFLHIGIYKIAQIMISKEIYLNNDIKIINKLIVKESNQYLKKSIEVIENIFKDKATINKKLKSLDEVLNKFNYKYDSLIDIDIREIRYL